MSPFSTPTTMAGKKKPATKAPLRKSSRKPKPIDRYSDVAKKEVKKAQQPKLKPKKVVKKAPQPKRKPKKLTTKPDPPRFQHFLEFPAEIRQMVYEFTLTENQQPVVVDRRNDDRTFVSKKSERRAFPILSTGLMAVNRQIRNEVDQLYYKLNDFEFLQPKAQSSRDILNSWLADQERSNQLRGVTCGMRPVHCSLRPYPHGSMRPIYGPSFTMRTLGFCKNLVNLNIVIYERYLVVSNILEQFQPLHGFAHAEAVLFHNRQEVKDSSLPGYIHENHEVQNVLEQLRSPCPIHCAGHALRKRVQIRFASFNSIWFSIF